MCRLHAVFRDFYTFWASFLPLNQSMKDSWPNGVSTRFLIHPQRQMNCLIRRTLSTNKQTNKSRFSWCRRTGAREAVLLPTRRCWQPLRNLFPHSLHYGTMFATNWSSNGGLAAEASVTCRRSQWSNSSNFSLLFSPPKRFFVTWPPLPKLGTKDLLKAQRWVFERESNLLPLLYKLNSLTPISSLHK